MGYQFDFGFDSSCASWDDAKIAFLFAAMGGQGDFGVIPGPLAVADASRYAELYEIDGDFEPFDIGVYAELCGGSDSVESAASRFNEARSKGILPVVIGADRRVTQAVCDSTLVALWGKLGRQEADEKVICEKHRTFLTGARAATSSAIGAPAGDVTLLTCQRMAASQNTMASALDKIEGPVHLSIDLDVLSPGVAKTHRSLEPGGLSWYGLIDAIDAVVSGPGIGSAELVGCKEVAPRSPGALLAAQILIKLVSALWATHKR